jgi:hypothetical protein
VPRHESLGTCSGKEEVFSSCPLVNFHDGARCQSHSSAANRGTSNPCDQNRKGENVRSQNGLTPFRSLSGRLGRIALLNSPISAGANLPGLFASASLVTHLDTESTEGSDDTMTTQPKNPELLERSTQ